MGCGAFKRGVQYVPDIFLPKNQHAQGKLLNFENWVKMGRCKKGPKFDFQSQFSISKTI